MIGTLAMHPMQNTFFSKPALLPPESVALGLEKGFMTLISDSDPTTYPYLPLNMPPVTEEMLVQPAPVVETVTEDNTDTTMVEQPVASDAEPTTVTQTETTEQETTTELAEPTTSNPLDLLVNTIDSDEEKSDEPPRKRVKRENATPKAQRPPIYFQLAPSDERNPNTKITWNYPQTEEEKRRFAVYKDLHEKNYYMTAGDRFGCDFLAYKEDPLLVHSEFMVFIVSYQEHISPNSVVSLGRMGNTTHKTSMYATITPDGKVKYISLDWFHNLQPLKEFKKYVIANKAQAAAEDTVQVSTDVATGDVVLTDEN